jgi:hypothetical protein
LKKFFALLLLHIYLLNIGGQLVLHQYMVYKTNKFYNQQVSKGLYNVQDLTEIAIPVNLPNIQDWNEFKNIVGQIQFGNTNYNYVKMRMTRTAIHLICIPNYETTHPAKENVLNARGVKDIPVPQKDHVPYGKIIMQDNVSVAFAHIEFCCPIKYLQKNIVQPEQQPVHFHQDIPEQPPKITC